MKKHEEIELDMPETLTKEVESSGSTIDIVVVCVMFFLIGILCGGVFYTNNCAAQY